MSIFSNIAKSLLHLLYPATCTACRKPLAEDEHFICAQCRNEAPRTYLWLSDDNPMLHRFWGRLPIEHASAFLWFVDQSYWREIIHRFKYDGEWRVALEFGRWYGSELQQSGALDDIDLIVSIPLHWRKRLKRGYNQAEQLCKGLSDASGKPYDFRAVRRIRNNKSQVRSETRNRWGNVSDIFKVTHAERLRNRHILLVDDVFTTGATISSCARSIIDACEGEVKISVTTIAISQRQFDME